VAEKHIANVEAQWKAVCTTPDVCKVGKKPVPFDSYRDLSNELKASPNVYARGTHVYRLTDWVRGTDGNAGKGVVSQTSQQPGHVRLVGDDTRVKVNGLVCARHDTVVEMNVGPGGPNTVGKLVTSQGAPAGLVENGKLPCNDPPKTSPQLEKLQGYKEKLSFMDPNQLDEYVRFGDLNQMADEGIAAIDVKDEGGWSTAGNVGAQVTRGALGFVKDIGLGLGQLVYTAGKYGNPAGMIHGSLDAQILAEQIRLGNICLESLKQAAKAAGHELAKPVTDAWEKGNYVEAVTRAGLEIGSLVLAVGSVAKLGQGAKVAEVAGAGAKAGEAATAGGKAAEAAGAGVKAAEDLSAAGKAADAAKTGEAAGVPVEVGQTVTKSGRTVKVFSTKNWNGVKIKARSLRELFLGKTPGKNTKTGREVIERMEKEGKIRENAITGEKEFQASDSQWYDMSKADMAHHPRDAVSWWNQEGRNYGARSPEVREFMTNSNNYILDHQSINRSAGARLNETYNLPLK